MSIATAPTRVTEASDFETSTPDQQTMADLLEQLGGIPANRVRLRPPPGTATEADVILASGKGRLCELVDGTLVEKPMGVPESYLANLIAWYLNNFVVPRRLGIVCSPDGMFRMLHGNIREPDVSFTRKMRLPTPLPQVGGWCPDLCVEVLSPANTPQEMQAKRQEYFEGGCGLVWEIDPRKRTARAYTSADSCRVLAENDSLTGGEVLPGFTLSLAELFSTFDDGLQPSP